MPVVPTAEDVARVRALTRETAGDPPFTDEDLTERLTRLTCPARTDPVTLAYVPERADVYAAAAEVWEEKALALLPEPGVAVGGGAKLSERTGDVSVTFSAPAEVGPRDYYAMARRMARRSCSFASSRSVDLSAMAGRALTVTLVTYDAWYDAVMASRTGLALTDPVVVNRAEPRV